MKKRFVSICFVLAMVLSLVSPFMVSAADSADHTLYLTEGKAYKGVYSSEGWDKEGDPLPLPAGLTYADDEWTMNGFHYITDAQTAVVFAGDAVLNLDGKNTVESTYDGKERTSGIETVGALMIRGGGSLSVNGGDSADSFSYGILVRDDITVNGGSVTAKSKVSGKSSYGLYVKGSMTVNDGSMTAIGEESAGSSSYGIFADGLMTVTGGDVTAHSGKTKDCSSYGIIASSPVKITGGSVEAKGGVSFNRDSYGIYADTVIEVSGGSLTADGGSAGYSSYGICVNHPMTVSGTGSVTAAGGESTDSSSYGIYAVDTMTVSDKGSVKAGGGSAKDQSSYGIRFKKDLTIDGGSLAANGGSSERASYGICADAPMTVSGTGSVTVKGGKSASSSSYGIYAEAAVAISGKAVVKTTGGTSQNSSSYGVNVRDLMTISGGSLTAAGGTASKGVRRGIDGTGSLKVIGGKISGDIGPYFSCDLQDSGYVKTESGPYMSCSNILTEKGRRNISVSLPMDVHVIREGNELGTTYKDRGYIVETSGLGDALVNSDAELVYDGHYVLLSYTVTSGKAIKGGKLGVWSDIQIGDNGRAAVTVKKEKIRNEETAVGLELLDDHSADWKDDDGNSCSSQNARIMCYFGGRMLENAVEGACRPADTYWFGYYGDADDYVFDPLDPSTVNSTYKNRYQKTAGEYTGMTGTNSGFAVSWKIDQKAGETKTYYILIGDGEAEYEKAPAPAEEKVPDASKDSGKTKKKAEPQKQSMPSNGTLRSGNGSEVELIINIPENMDYVFLRMYNASGRAVGQIFIHPGKNATLYLASGTYTIKIATGTEWYGEKDLFGENGGYYQLLNGSDTSFELSRGTWTLTIGGVTNGNVGSKNIGGAGNM